MFQVLGILGNHPHLHLHVEAAWSHLLGPAPAALAFEVQEASSWAEIWGDLRVLDETSALIHVPAQQPGIKFCVPS